MRMRYSIRLLNVLCCLLAMPASAWQGGLTIFGHVYLPDGKAAPRVKIKITIVNGFTREFWSDDHGNYEMRGIPAGRYHVTAANPDEPEQFSEPAESDSTRSYANRLQIDVYLRWPIKHEAQQPKPGVISIAEAGQKVPGAARKAFEQGVKLQKENQPDKALAQFNLAIEQYPAYFQALTERGSLLMSRNQLLEAANDFTAALKLNDKYAPALRGLGYCQLQQKQYEPAIANLERAYAAAPDVALTLMLLGYANLSVERYEPARQCLQEALRLDPTGAARAHVYLAEILAHEQKFKEAAAEIQRYLKDHPNAADAASLKEMAARWQARSQSKP